MKLFYKYMTLSLLALAMFVPVTTLAADNFPATQNFAGQNLTLNGKGIRTKLFFDLYTAGLYLQKPAKDGKAILAGNQPMALRLEITSAMITSETMETAVRDGFKQSASTQLTALQPRIEQLIKIFRQKINKGDIYDFVYNAQKMTILKNGKNAGVISGADFKQAFYGIWLGEKPAQANLKAKLLGG